MLSKSATRIARKWASRRWAHLNPCERVHSYGWIDPTGKLHVMNGSENHVEWAGKSMAGSPQAEQWEAEIRVKFPRIQDAFLEIQVAEKAFSSLLSDGWVRVTSPTVLQAVDIKPHTPPWLKVMSLLIEGATEGCVNPEGTAYVNIRGGDKKIPVWELVDMLGDKRSQDDFFAALLNRR